MANLLGRSCYRSIRQQDTNEYGALISTNSEQMTPEEMAYCCVHHTPRLMPFSQTMNTTRVNRLSLMLPAANQKSHSEQGGLELRGLNL
jgi:hypothetical protein